MFPIISIIVPVHNSEKFLRQLITSVFDQSFQNWELIFVLDGVQASSKKQIDICSANDNRIRVIQQLPQSGQGSARILGLNHALGEYFLFLDSDDLLSKNALEELHKSAITFRSDLVIGDYFEFKDGKDIRTLPKKGSIGFNHFFSQYPRVFSSSDFREFESLYENVYYVVVWNKLFRRDVWFKNNLTMPKLVSMGDDLLVVAQFVFCSRKITHIDAVVTYHRLRKSSVTGSRTKNAIGILQIHDQVSEIISSMSLGEIDTRQVYISYLHWIESYFTNSITIHDAHFFFKEGHKVVIGFPDLFDRESHFVYKKFRRGNFVSFIELFLALYAQYFLRKSIKYFVKFLSRLIPRFLRIKLLAFLLTNTNSHGLINKLARIINLI
jgi:glycosyltransferase involved in cell wall biosynthesis